MPSAPPICWVVFTSALATPASSGSTPISAVLLIGDEREPHAEADEDLGRQHVADVGAVDAEPGEPAAARARRARVRSTMSARARSAAGAGSTGRRPRMIPPEKGRKAKPVFSAE